MSLITRKLRRHEKTGGRGASSGISKSGKVYGTEFTTVYQTGNIKFVKSNSGNATPPMETMTKGRIYVNVNNQDKLKSIIYFDKHNKRYKQIDLDHSHKIDNKWISPHTHYGYFHDENGTKKLTPNQKKMVDRIVKTWYNRLGK